jgi:hypothetical protein
LVALAAGLLSAQTPLKVTTPKESLGFSPGDDFKVASYTQLETYWKKLAVESPRVRLVDIGATAEGRRQYMAIVSSPENLKRLDHYKEIARRLALAEDLNETQARALAREGKAVVWIDGGLHSNETVGSEQLAEMVYQMASRTDAETLRLLDDTIQLYVSANPDGMELAATWYMHESDPMRRTLASLPRLYEKYAGHDDNRDFYMSNLPETTNLNRQMFSEWFPQIVYDHHQTGPAGTVVFIPPFRDPFNYNLDPLIPLGIEMVGAAMHSRLVEEGKGGSAMRGASSYSAWWNGGLRTVANFHNMIGILTEIVGSPTPGAIPLAPDRQLPQTDLPLPVAPQTWHYRQSIEYEISQNRAVLDYASRYRETLLYNIYRMGRNSIERGSRDSWTISPRRIQALRAAATDSNSATIAPGLYDQVLHDAEHRDPRGYVMPSDQPDFGTAIKFANTLLKNGVTVLRATAAFTAGVKTYPAGTLVVKAAQAFRPHILDMFEPQDYPNDFRYPGGPPIAPYDVTGWTLALQMGIAFDRVLDDFGGSFEKVAGLLGPVPRSITGLSGPHGSRPTGYLVDHRANASFTLMNRLLKAGSGKSVPNIYWLKRENGAIWIPYSDAARAVIEKGVAELGLTVWASAETRLVGDAYKLRPVRIGLVDREGGLAPSGWTRWLFEQFEFPFAMVDTKSLETGDPSGRFDVLVFPDGAFRNADTRVTAQIKRFTESGGTVVAIGSSTAIAAQLGLPVRNRVERLKPESFYIPGSLLRTHVETSHPLAYGMPSDAIVFFDQSPVFDFSPPDLEASPVDLRKVAWFDGPEVLASGWAWGQEHLDGGTAVAEASLGRGKVILLGPEIAFRAQSHGTFKLLFNALLYGQASVTTGEALR